MNIGLIGAGARSQLYCRLMIAGAVGDVQIKAVSDLHTDRMAQLCANFVDGAAQPACFDDYEQLLQDPSIDAVIICTPDTTHREIAIAAMKAGKHILLEKPMATTMADAAEVYKATANYGKVFRMGFVLRYAPIYRKIKQLVESGELGKLITIEAKEMLGYMHGGSYFRRWHRFRANTGGFLNAKCSHDMDLLSWIVDEEPIAVSSFGNRSYFNSRANASTNCRDCGLKRDCKYVINLDEHGINNSEADLCVFNSDKDIVDHQVVSLAYGSGLTMSFTVSTLSAQANRVMTIFGSEATLFADFKQNRIELQTLYPAATTVFTFAAGDEGYGRGDEAVLKDFIEAARNRDCSGNSKEAKSGMLSMAITQAAERSMADVEVVDMSKYLLIFGIEV